MVACSGSDSSGGWLAERQRYCAGMLCTSLGPQLHAVLKLLYDLVMDNCCELEASLLVGPAAEHSLGLVAVAVRIVAKSDRLEAVLVRQQQQGLPSGSPFETENLLRLALFGKAIVASVFKGARSSPADVLAAAAVPRCMALAASAAANAVKTVRLTPTAENVRLLEYVLLLAGWLHGAHGTVSTPLTQRIRCAHA